MDTDLNVETDPGKFSLSDFLVGDSKEQTRRFVTFSVKRIS